MTFNITDSRIGMISGIMDGNNMDTILAIALFALFIYLAFKAFSILKNTILIMILAVIFPFFMNRVFSLGMDTSLSGIFGFMMVGVVLYLAYEGVKLLYSTSKLFFGLFNIILLPFIAIAKFIRGIFSSKEPKKHKKAKKHKKISEEEE